MEINKKYAELEELFSELLVRLGYMLPMNDAQLKVFNLGINDAPFLLKLSKKFIEINDK